MKLKESKFNQGEKMNQSERDVGMRLSDYRERVRKIERMEADLVRVKLDHNTQTKIDFGIADGEILSVASLAELVLKLNNEKEEKQNDEQR